MPGSKKGHSQGRWDELDLKRAVMAVQVSQKAPNETKKKRESKVRREIGGKVGKKRRNDNTDQQKEPSKPKLKKQKKTRSAQKSVQNQDDTVTPVACYKCRIVERSDQDIKLDQDWIQCKTCMIWCHEKCGEDGGLFDDEYFYCALCAMQM
jgi:hypothetical protein